MENQKNTNPAYSEKELREVLAFPRLDLFYNTLMDRLHMVLREFFLGKKFTIFLTVIPRDHEVGEMKKVPRFEPFELSYAGVRKQRAFLEGSKEERKKTLDEFWDILENEKIESKESKVSKVLFEEYKNGNLMLEDIETEGWGKLTEYFAPKLDPNYRGEQLTKAQEAEYEILNAGFEGKIAQYYYLSLPLIQYAEFDGVAHIIYHEGDHGRLLASDGKISLTVIGNIIKAFSREYEGVILDWDTVDREKHLKSAFTSVVSERVYSEELKDNPILRELHYLDYYRAHKDYFDTRLELSGAIPLAIKRQYHQNAIMAILIDSYAHNISAHSLITLEWWFSLRAQLIKEKAMDEDFVDDYPYLPVIQQIDRPLEKEIRPLLRFLLDKGAFWTGLTRETNFGGKISSLHSVLWYDFINNPLYLGTIAYSEGILRININITFLEVIKKTEGVKVEKKVLLDGEFASIDLSLFEKESQNNDPDQPVHFVIKGRDYDLIEAELKKYRAFFPGGVVGRHAFFTILENEIRNVKHFSPPALDIMKEKGLTLNISIEGDSYENEGDVFDSSIETAYYKIGVWIKYPVNLSRKLILNRLEKLNGDITTGEDHRARLGGVFQDKVCAAMLFTNAFSSVQDENLPTFKRYYPWVKVGSSPNIEYKTEDVIEDIELSARRYFNKKFKNSRKFFDDHFQTHQGYYKKFFHLWKGEDIYVVETEKEKLSHQLENLSRFSFVCLPQNDPLHFAELRNAGVIRLIYKETQNITSAYREWLGRWLKDHPKSYSILMTIAEKNRQLAAQLDFDGSRFVFHNRENLEKGLSDPDNNQELNLLHGSALEKTGAHVCRYRSHGILKRYFLGGQDIHLATMSEDLAAELLEVLATRICIFDNRIYDRLEILDKEIYRNQLLCDFYPEDVNDWAKEKEKGFFNHHFLVIHLSFIEAFRSETGEKKYNEEDISDFIEQEILDGKEPPENFIVVITTGRGRTHWWSELKRKEEKEESKRRLSFTTYITFRPVESLVAVIENSLSMKDDVELKYRLVKVLFGS